MINEPMLSLIGDVLNAWIPVLMIVGGSVAAVALVRFFAVMILEAISAQPAPGRAHGYQPLIFDWITGAPEPPVAAAPQPAQGPWYRRLVWEVAQSWQRVWRRAVAYVRGDVDNPWWRVSWAGLEAAFNRANWAMFFALFFGAFVCAAAVAAGFPFAATLALYAALGIVWVMVMITVVLSLIFGQVSYLIVGFVCELGALLGYVLVSGVVLAIGFIVAALTGRVTAYLMTLGRAKADVWNARIVTQQEAMAQQKEEFERQRERYRVDRARRNERRAERAKRSKARKLWDFFKATCMLGMVVLMYGIVLIAANSIPRITELGQALRGMLFFLTVLIVSIGILFGLMLLEYRRHHKRYGEPPDTLE